MTLRFRRALALVCSVAVLGAIVSPDITQSEKANVAQQMAAGGEYKRKIDARIAEIKSACGVN